MKRNASHTLRVEARLDRLEQLVNFVIDRAREIRLPEKAVEDLHLAVDEACTNIIRHAYGGPCDALVHLHLEREGDELRFELLDDAPCCDAATLHPRDLADCRPGGLGINFIDSLMDHWSLTPRADGCGNRLWMVKHVTEQGDTR